MVTFNDGGHEHEDGTVCPGCRFRAVLAEHLAWAAGDSDESWHDLTGEMIELMGTALGALTRLRATRLDGDHEDDDHSAQEAAAVISQLGGVIDETWHALMDDD